MVRQNSFSTDEIIVQDAENILLKRPAFARPALIRALAAGRIAFKQPLRDDIVAHSA